MAQEIAFSICTFNDGKFDVMVKEVSTGREIILSGERKVSDDDLELINRIAPACVWTKYKTETTF